MKFEMKIDKDIAKIKSDVFKNQYNSERD